MIAAIHKQAREIAGIVVLMPFGPGASATRFTYSGDELKLHFPAAIRAVVIAVLLRFIEHDPYR